jgi:hypothetical protein
LVWESQRALLVSVGGEASCGREGEVENVRREAFDRDWECLRRLGRKKIRDRGGIFSRTEDGQDRKESRYVEVATQIMDSRA